MPLNIFSLSPREQVSAIYIAYYDRAPDPAGIDYWVDILTSNQLTLNGIAQAFSTAAETKLKYPFFNNPDPVGYSSFVDAIYQNLFGRDPDAAGKAFWTGVLSTEAVKLTEFILEVLKGAQDTNTLDLSTIQNKIDVAEDWAADAAVNSIGTAQNPFAEEIDGEFFVRDAAVFGSATSILDGVTEEPASAITAKAETDAFFTGQFLTITPSADAFDEGTAASFTFNTTAEEGSVIAFTIAGTVDEADISGGLTGLTIVGADGSATISIDLIADEATEGSETLTLLAGIGGETNLQATVDTVVNDTSVEDVVTVPTQEIAPFIANATEYGIGDEDSSSPAYGVHSLLDADSFQPHWAGEGSFNRSVELTYGFVEVGAQVWEPKVGTFNATQSYNENEKITIREVFEAFSSVANIKFTEVEDASSTSSADIRVIKASSVELNEVSGLAGFAYQPFNPLEGKPITTENNPIAAKNTTELSHIGDIFLVSDNLTDNDNLHDWTIFEYDEVKSTFAHELGHALGLDHPFSEVPGAGLVPITSRKENLQFENYKGELTGGGHHSEQTDNLLETIMTYYSPSARIPLNLAGTSIIQSVANWKPGVMDIAALQHLYGANKNYNVGDNLYEFNSRDISYDTIWDAGGIDTLKVLGDGPSYIDLNDGAYSKLGAVSSAIYQVDLIEAGFEERQIADMQAFVKDNEVGLNVTIADDGNSAAFSIDLSTLGDMLTNSPLDGDITIKLIFTDGGDIDVDIAPAAAFYQDGQTAFNFGIAHGAIIENVETSSGDDVIIGNAFSNEIISGGGVNYLTGNGGADKFIFSSETTSLSETFIRDFTRGEDLLDFRGDFAFSKSEQANGNWILAWDDGRHSITLEGVTDFDFALDVAQSSNPVMRLGYTNSTDEYWVA